jgi:hypothetical protein
MAIAERFFTCPMSFLGPLSSHRALSSSCQQEKYSHAHDTDTRMRPSLASSSPTLFAIGLRTLQLLNPHPCMSMAAAPNKKEMSLQKVVLLFFPMDT